MFAAKTVLVVAVAITAAVALKDVCSSAPNCTACISTPFCGWCSEDVVYPDHVKGKQCAGFSPDGHKTFQCNGVFSTEECAVGYKCDMENFVCKIVGPGDGKSKALCEANCTNHGQVFLCNHTDMKCHPAKAGTKGASGLQSCEAACMHPSHHPSSHHPSPPHTLAPVYACNHTSGECAPATAGHGSGSKAVCETQCKKATPGKKYVCNSFEKKCVVAPAGIPGVNKTACDDKCSPQPKPGPPPAFLGGLWRGIEIQNGYAAGEWDMKFTETQAVIVNVQKAVTIKGTPFNVKSGEKLDLWIKVTSGPGAGKTIKVVGEKQGRGPETNFLTAAFGAAGGAAPASVNAAMKSAGEQVFFLSQCAGTPECVFTMPSSSWLAGQASMVRGTRRILTELISNGAAVELAFNPLEITDVDHCTAFSANCSECIAQKNCGWCSKNVTYKDGAVGSQCAGFNADPNKSNKFICRGQYSTLNCDQGYECDKKSRKCVIDPTPGNGLPLSECEQVCKPTPPPTPKPKQAVCNTTTHKCHPCNETHCPGSMSESACAAACVKPHKGPTHLVVGAWRGLKIQNGYPMAEFELTFNASSLTFYEDGKVKFTAKVTSYGGDVMIFDADDGSKYSCDYSVADQSGLYSAMTMAVSKPGGPIPSGFAGAMKTPPMYEMVLAKCNGPPCVFNKP
jgi:hypothetical protein